MGTHWHVAYGITGYGPDGADGYNTATTPTDLAELLQGELFESSEVAGRSADIIADTGQFEQAWHEHKKSEELWTLSQNFDNNRAKAPLYAGDPAAWDATIVKLMGAHFPMAVDHDDTRRLYAWECPESECEHARDDADL